MNIQLCKCSRSVLSTRQTKGGMPCNVCQEEKENKGEKTFLTGGENGSTIKIVSSNNR